MNLGVAKRFGFGAAVTVWGTIMVYFYASGRIASYVAPDFHAWVLCGGMGMCVLGVFTMLTAGDGVGNESCDHDHDHGDDHDHDHDHSDVHPLVALIIVLVPLIGAAFATQDRLSNEAMERKASGEVGDVSGFFEELPPYTLEYLEENRRKTDDGYFEMPLLEVYFGTDNDEMRGVLDGLPVSVEGRVMRERKNNEEGKRLRLVRLMMNCCAADSQAIPLVVEWGDAAPEGVLDTWGEARGKLSFEMVGGRPLPFLRVEKFTTGPLPASEMMNRRLPGVR